MHRRLLPFFLPALLACAAGEPRADAGVRFDTVGGVPHAVNRGEGFWTRDSRWRLAADRAVEIGVLDGPEPYVFGDVAGVVVTPDGRIHVADAQALEVRVFSAAGDFLTRFGRAGEGPGEFRQLGGLGRAPGGGVAALDGRLGRVSLFDPDGRFQRGFRIERPYMRLESGVPVRFDAAGRFYDRTGLSSGIGVDTIGVVRYAADGRVEDTTLVAVHEPAHLLARRNGVPVASFAIPFAPRPAGAVGPDGAIYVTSGVEYAIARLSPTGDTLLVIRRELEPRPVGAAERDSALAWLRERYRRTTGVEPRELPALPQRHPAVVALRVDETGHLWALRPPQSGAATTAWDVFDPRGRLLGTLALPPMRVLHIGEGTVAGVVRDELDVPRVRVLPLERGGAAGGPAGIAPPAERARSPAR